MILFWRSCFYFGYLFLLLKKKHEFLWKHFPGEIFFGDKFFSETPFYIMPRTEYRKLYGWCKDDWNFIAELRLLLHTYPYTRNIHTRTQSSDWTYIQRSELASTDESYQRNTVKPFLRQHKIYLHLSESFYRSRTRLLSATQLWRCNVFWTLTSYKLTAIKRK